MKVLVLAGDVWHPAAVVEAGLQPLAEKGDHFEFKRSLDEQTLARLSDYSIIILAKANHVSEHSKTPWVTEEADQAIDHFVRAGGGLLVIHAGTARYRETQCIRALTGGIFLQHPDKCPVKVQFDQNHILSQGLTDFTLRDEHYFMQLDESVELFLTTESEHGSQPAGWLKQVGHGRVCVLTPGHFAEVWLQESMQRLIKNALNWCAQ